MRERKDTAKEGGGRHQGKQASNFALREKSFPFFPSTAGNFLLLLSSPCLVPTLDMFLLFPSLVIHSRREQQRRRRQREGSEAECVSALASVRRP